MTLSGLEYRYVMAAFNSGWIPMSKRKVLNERFFKEITGFLKSAPRVKGEAVLNLLVPKMEVHQDLVKNFDKIRDEFEGMEDLLFRKRMREIYSYQKLYAKVKDYSYNN